MTKMTDQLDMNRIPEHIAIIMDGNGRWANVEKNAATAIRQVLKLFAASPQSVPVLA